MDGMMSALDPAGIQAARINTLAWFLFIVGTLVTLGVTVGVLLAVVRGRRHGVDGEPDLSPDEARDKRMTRVIIGLTGISAVILLTFLFASYLTGRGVGTLVGPRPLTIDVIGHQWWWEVIYPDTNPSLTAVTANEIHVPVGRPVLLRGTSRDVIHSFWVPRLAGKKDLIPGHRTVTWFRADKPGTYRGQCAEFCGHQHAKMAFIVIAEPEADFNAWLARQRAPATPPADSSRVAGQQVFLSSSCVMCHTVRGTPAGSRFGPDLTHLAGRRTLAAGSIPNSRGHLAGWILDPQKIKPGTYMPANQLDPKSLHALLDYLHGLQ